MQEEITIQDENFPISYSKEYKTIYRTEVGALRWGWIRTDNGLSLFIEYTHPDAEIREANRIDVTGEDFIKANQVLEETVIRVYSKLFPNERK
jgi:hypothetical protein